MKIWSMIVRHLAGASGRRVKANRAVRLFVSASLATLALAAQTNPATAAQSATAATPQTVRGEVPAAVAGLQPAGRLAATNRLNLAIGLPLRNRAALDTLIQQIYDPASPNYHQYLTTAQFTEMFGPSEADYQAVIAYAQANGFTVTATHPNRMIVDVRASAADIERAFHVTMRTYPHPKESRTFYAPDADPTLNLAVPVLHISGLNNYALPHPMISRNSFKQKSDAAPRLGSEPIFGNYWGNDFRAAYAPGVTLTGAGQKLGLLEFDGYYSNDIALYVEQTGLTNVPLTDVYIDGFDGTPGPGNSEVALDIEVAIAMAPGLDGIIVYQAPNPSPWVDLLSRMANDNSAKQLSCSWGGGSPEPVADQIFLQMAAQGQSFFNAVGDSDAFIGAIDFPADNPYITQVGGTTLSTTGPAGAWVSETVWNWGNEYGPIADGIGGSGGVSTYYSIPSYQQGIDMSFNQGSTTMRNVPDVALTADNIYVVADNGVSEYGTGGTSAAAPLWAAFTALVNQQGALNSKPAVGFLNPALYSIGKGPAANYAAAFHDIKTGDNTWSLSPDRFLAVPGYDLCTGWGTPTGQKTIDALAGLQSRSGLLQITAVPPAGSALISSTTNSIFITVTDVYSVTNATVTATIPGVTNLTFLNDGTAPDVTAGDSVYSASLRVPATPGPITMTVIASATNEISATNSFAYTVVVPPSNDNFANAIKVPAAGAAYLSNNRFATLETGEPKHAGDTNAAGSLWWSWSPTVNTNVLLDTQGSAIDTVMAVYTGPAVNNLVSVIATNDVGSVKQAYLSFNATAGTTYNIAVASANSKSLGSLRLAVRPGGQLDTTVPEVQVASPLSGLWVNNKLIAVSGTADDPEPNPSGLSKVVVSVNGQWQFTANGTTSWTCPVALTPGLNTLQVTAQDIEGNVSTPASLQVTYVELTTTNDLFANALPLTTTPEVDTGSNTNATKEFGEPDHAGNAGGKSVWWWYRPPADGTLVLNTTNSSFDTLLGLYTGPNVASLTTIADDDDAYPGAPGGFSEITQAVRSNQLYYVAVDGYNGAAGAISLHYSFVPGTVYRLTTASTSGGTVQVTTTNSMGGTQVMPGTAGDFSGNTTVVLTGTPYSFYDFSGWTGSVTSPANPLSLVLTSNLDLTGQFLQTAYTDGFESGNLRHLTWTNGGNATWFVQTNVVAAGQYAARSGVIGNSQSSSLILTTNFAGGLGSFDYRVSSETNFDMLSFYVDGVLLHRWSGEVGWSHYLFTVTAGTHTLEWRYTKDPNLSVGLDAGFIDDVNLPLGVGLDSSSPAHLQIVRQTDGTLVINLSGQTNQQYIVQMSTNLTAWQNVSTNVATGGFIQIPIPAGGLNSAQFYRAIVAPQ